MDSNQAKTSSSCTNQSFDHNRSNNNNINKSALPDNQEEEIPCVRLSPSSSSHLMRLLDGSWDNIFRQWQILAFGQVVSFLNVANGAAQASLALSCHLYAPLFTLGLVYSILAMGLIPLWWKRRNEQDNELEDELLNKDPQSVATHATTIERCMTSSSHGNQSQPAFLPDPTRKYSLFGIVRLNAPAIAYLPMAVLDVSAQFFFLTALRYTTLTSVTLLDSVAIPAAMLLSSLLLARKYRPAHFLGICLCFVGIYIDVFHDYTAEDETETDGTDAEDYPHKLRGDLMAIAGACMFGTQEVLGEVAVRNLGGTNEYIALLGFWASMIAFLQSYLTEKDHIVSFFQEHDQAYCEKNQAWTLLFVYVLSTSLYYHGLARFLKMSDAAFVSPLLSCCLQRIPYDSNQFAVYRPAVD
jgi:solute carrier family 35 protein F1/2